MAAEAGAGGVVAGTAGGAGLEFLPGAGINDYIQRGHKFWGEGADAAAAGDYGKMSSDWLQGLMSAGDATLDVAPLAMGMAAPLGYAAVAGARRIPKMLRGFGDMMADTSGSLKGTGPDAPRRSMLDEYGINIDTPETYRPASYSPAEVSVAEMQGKYEEGNFDMTPPAVLKRLKNAAGAELKAAGYDDTRMLEALQGLIPEGSNSKHINPLKLEDFMAQNIYAPSLTRVEDASMTSGVGLEDEAGDYERVFWEASDEPWDARAAPMGLMNMSDGQVREVVFDASEYSEMTDDIDTTGNMIHTRVIQTIGDFSDPAHNKAIADAFEAEAGVTSDHRQVSMIFGQDVEAGAIASPFVSRSVDGQPVDTSMLPEVDAASPVKQIGAGPENQYTPLMLAQVKPSGRHEAVTAFRENPSQETLHAMEQAFGSENFDRLIEPHSTYNTYDTEGNHVNEYEGVDEATGASNRSRALDEAQDVLSDNMPAERVTGEIAGEGDAPLPPGVGTDVHWKTYALKGGERYTELKFQLEPGAPHAGRRTFIEEPDMTGWKFKPTGDGRVVAFTPQGPNAGLFETMEQAQAQARAVQFEFQNRHTKPGTFRSPHSYPTNTTYTMRGAEHIDEHGNKVWNIDEIQNDWVAKGEDEGFVNPARDAALVRVEDRLGALKVEYRNHKDRLWKEVTGFKQTEARGLGRGEGVPYGKMDAAEEKVMDLMETDPAFNKVLEERASLIAAKLELKDQGGTVPRPPNIENWHKQAMQQTIRWATENGYDRVTWTTGKQQIDRYDATLRQNVDEITWRTDPASYGGAVGPRIVVHANKEGRQAYAGLFDVDGMSQDEFILTQGGERKKHHLSKLIGKEQADQILTGGSGTISGDDLTVGGRGMIAFYDDKMVNTMRKLAKQFGGTVGKTKIDTGPDGMQEVWTMDLTPKMKEKSAMGWARYAVPLAATAGAAAATQREDRPGI